MTGKRDWNKVNERLVKRGELLFDLGFLEKWDEEITKMNKGKNGHPFLFPKQFVAFGAMIHFLFNVRYRQMEGFFRGLSRFLHFPVPHFTTIQKRIAKMDVDLGDSLSDNADPVVIAVDSSGVKVSNRGGWMREKWKTRKGWIKIHIAVDVKTGEVISMETTTDEVGDSRMFGGLMEDAGKRREIEKVLGDGAYDSRDIFNILEEKGIRPGIKTRKNASTCSRGSPCRRKQVLKVRGIGYEAWRDETGYGQRWRAESVFSWYKRVFGEYVGSRSWAMMAKELRMKFFFYNMLVNGLSVQ